MPTEETLRQLPVGRSYQDVVQTVPGVNGKDKSGRKSAEVGRTDGDDAVMVTELLLVMIAGGPSTAPVQMARSPNVSHSSSDSRYRETVPEGPDSASQYKEVRV